jgi:hypothetical protein
MAGAGKRATLVAAVTNLERTRIIPVSRFQTLLASLEDA